MAPMLIKRILIGVAGAVASFYAIKYTTILLEKKPFKNRVEDAKNGVIGLKDTVKKKVLDLIQDKDIKNDIDEM